MTVELFDDPFVLEQFSRRKRIFSASIGRETWLPTPEDVIVQKLRWGRNKDLDDARDILAVQGPETLDMGYVESCCTRHHAATPGGAGGDSAIVKGSGRLDFVREQGAR